MREFASCDCADQSELDALLDQTRAALDLIERQLNRTLTGPVTRTAKTRQLPCDPIWLDYPPLISVDEFRYWSDATPSVEVTIDPAQYRVVTSTDGPSFIELADDFTTPTNIATRDDAITIQYTTGIDDTTNQISSSLQAAIILQTRLLFDPAGQSETALRRSIEDLVAANSWGWYV